MSLFPTTCYRGNADGTFTKISHEQYWAETMAAAVAEAFAEPKEPKPAAKTLKEIMAEQEAEAKKAKKKR
jgi:hypothetical protein